MPWNPIAPSHVGLDVDTISVRRLGALLLTLAALASPTAATGATGADPPHYTWTDQPSPVVLLRPSYRVRVKPISWCWTGPTTASGSSAGSCADGPVPPDDQLRAVHGLTPLHLWFGRPGWTFTGTLHRIPEGCTAIQQRAHIRPGVTAHRFLIPRPRMAGLYRVVLHGHGPEGDVTVAFKWNAAPRGAVGGPVAC